MEIALLNILRKLKYIYTEYIQIYAIAIHKNNLETFPLPQSQ